MLVPRPDPRTYTVERNGHTFWCVNFMRVNIDALQPVPKLQPVFPIRYPNPFRGVS